MYIMEDTLQSALSSSHHIGEDNIIDGDRLRKFWRLNDKNADCEFRSSLWPMLSLPQKVQLLAR